MGGWNKNASCVMQDAFLHFMRLRHQKTLVSRSFLSSVCVLSFYFVSCRRAGFSAVLVEPYIRVRVRVRASNEED